MTEVFDLGYATCWAFAAIKRYGRDEANIVNRLAETLAKFKTSFPLSARVAVAARQKQVLRKSGGQTAHLFDPEINLDELAGVKKP